MATEASTSSHYERACQMCLESTQALSNVLKIILTDSPDSQGGASLFVLRMLFAPSSFASLTKLIIPDSKLSPPETLDALFSSHVAQSWLSHRTSRDEILDVEQMGYFGPANSIDCLCFHPRLHDGTVGASTARFLFVYNFLIFSFYLKVQPRPFPAYAD